MYCIIAANSAANLVGLNVLQLMTDAAASKSRTLNCQIQYSLLYNKPLTWYNLNIPIESEPLIQCTKYAFPCILYSCPELWSVSTSIVQYYSTVHHVL